MNRTNKKIALVGGDMRQISAACELEKYRYSVSMYGFDTYGDTNSVTLDAALEGAEVLLLPIPVFRGDCLNMPFSHEKIDEDQLVSKLGEGIKWVFGGLIPKSFSEKLNGKGIKTFDFCENESFNMKNAIPTAEGAVAIAMGNMKITVSGCHAAILGFGRIGKALCRSLYGLGAEVTNVARNERDISLSEALGFFTCDYSQLSKIASEQDVIFNTVPATVVTEETLENMKKDAFIVDLASRPGGVDVQAAARCGVRVISALSLPGKVAPVTAGRIIAECLIRTLSEVEL